MMASSTVQCGQVDDLKIIIEFDDRTDEKPNAASINTHQSINYVNEKSIPELAMPRPDIMT